MENKGRFVTSLLQGALIAGFMLAAALATPAAAAPRESVFSIPSRPDVTQGLFLIEPAGPPRAIAVLYIGGGGELALEPGGPLKGKGNFLMRIRPQLSAAGLILVYPDTPSDQKNGYGDFRISSRHGEDIAAVVKALKARHDLPLFLIGTSRGTISATNGAGRLSSELVAGVVLTSTVTERSQNRQRPVFDTPLGDIKTPVFVLSHKDDTCYVTPPSAIPRLLSALRAAPRKDMLLLSGGKPAKSEPCEALSAHGFFGIEDQAAKAITDWIEAVLTSR